VFCALGGVVTSLTHDVISVVQGTTTTHNGLSDAFERLKADSVNWLSQQVELDRLTAIDHESWAELRYKGQSFQVSVAIPANADGSYPDLETIADLFHEEHNRLYAHCDRTAPVEFVELRVRIQGSLPSPGTIEFAETEQRDIAPIHHRDIRIAGRRYEGAPVYSRVDLRNGSRVEGPCIIEEDDSTILVPATYTARAIASGAISLNRRS
jgi:N-methylhydantoinase A